MVKRCPSFLWRYPAAGESHRRRSCPEARPPGLNRDACRGRPWQTGDRNPPLSAPGRFDRGIPQDRVVVWNSCRRRSGHRRHARLRRRRCRCHYRGGRSRRTSRAGTVLSRRGCRPASRRDDRRVDRTRLVRTRLCRRHSEMARGIDESDPWPKNLAARRARLGPRAQCTLNSALSHIKLSVAGNRREDAKTYIWMGPVWRFSRPATS